MKVRGISWLLVCSLDLSRSSVTKKQKTANCKPLKTSAGKHERTLEVQEHAGGILPRAAARAFQELAPFNPRATGVLQLVSDVAEERDSLTAINQAVVVGQGGEPGTGQDMSRLALHIVGQHGQQHLPGRHDGSSFNFAIHHRYASLDRIGS